MKNLKLFAVIKKAKERDEFLSYIYAVSLKEAVAVFNVRHAEDKEEMEIDEEILIFQANKALEFDANNRVEIPKGSMYSINRF